ncbi:MAG: hypothetical protein JWO22_209 [Frankiales bacterium]|nr:hypothetical protein [Frankiales bacterium]
MTRRLLVLLLGMVAAVTLASPALAATHPVTLSPGNGTVNVTVSAGDTVTFRAGDGSTYHVTSGKGWSFAGTVTTAKPATTKPFNTPGTYAFTSTFDTVLGSAPSTGGSIVLPAKATPTPTTPASAKPSASATPKPSTSSSLKPSASASATQSGVAVPPPITGGVIPTPDVSTSAGPQPQVAPTAGGAAGATTSPTAVANTNFADPSTLVQKSPHGFGLPVALAVVAVVGVVTLLVRFLLAAPEAQRPVG